jgi:tetratricopeptide (TPR) repeat protein
VLALDPALEGVDFTRALYIDTETTGLSGGSGTLPFLIGMAWFEQRKLVVEQLFLERPGHEAAMLMRLSELLSRASCIVSYNGKSFDWPLLRTRYILNRVAAPPIPAHLDLLHCARRVYKRRLGAVRLVHLEEQILGFTRVDDIAGELIPQTYLGFLRGQVPAAELVPIIDHNRHDLVALAAMQGEIVRRFRAQDASQDARDQLGFAHVAARASDPERALLFAHGAAEADVRGELAPDALYLAGELKYRQGDVQGAIEAYQQSVSAAPEASAQAARAHLALAKLLEHRLKAYDRALHHARHTSDAEGHHACEKRVGRLQRKSASTLRLL